MTISFKGTVPFTSFPSYQYLTKLTADVNSPALGNNAAVVQVEGDTSALDGVEVCCAGVLLETPLGMDAAGDGHVLVADIGDVTGCDIPRSRPTLWDGISTTGINPNPGTCLTGHWVSSPFNCTYMAEVAKNCELWLNSELEPKFRSFGAVVGVVGSRSSTRLQTPNQQSFSNVYGQSWS